MSTPNFHNVNARKHFVVTCQEEYVFTDTIDNVKFEMRANKKFSFHDSGNDPDELRSYPSRVIGQFFITKEYRGCSVTASLTAIARSGYYDAANLDWYFEFEVDEHSDHRKNSYQLIEKWADKQKDAMVDELEKIFALYTDQYIRVAVFSNGEAVYEKA